MDTVYALAAAPHFATSRICFAARHTGLYRSSDGGLTWRSTFGTLRQDQPPTATAVAVSPNFDHDGIVLAGVHGAVLRSIDSGSAWTAWRLAGPPSMVSVLSCSPGFQADGVAFAGTLEAGVYRSVDRGTSWTGANFGLLDLGVLCLAFSPDFMSDETILVGTESGLYRSTNGGRAWREVGADIGVVLCVAAMPTMVVAGMEDGRLLCSEDVGESWQDLDGHPAAGPVNALAVMGQNILTASGNHVHVSQDRGRTWTSRLVAEGAVTAVIVPCRLAPDCPALLGLGSGQVLHQPEFSAWHK